MKEDFKQANVFTAASDIQILASKPENPEVTRRESSLSCTDLSHNRTKTISSPTATLAIFLIHLGVMDTSGKVIPKHYGKFRQINRYLGDSQRFSAISGRKPLSFKTA